MLEELIETAVEIAVDVAEAVITEKAKKKDPQACGTGEENAPQPEAFEEAFVTSRHFMLE